LAARERNDLEAKNAPSRCFSTDAALTEVAYKEATMATPRVRPHSIETQSPQSTGKRSKGTDVDRLVKLSWIELGQVKEAEDALETVESLLSYVGNAGQGGGEDGAAASWTAIGISETLSIIRRRLERFREFTLRTPSGGI
jgi:hypothetical protein